MIARLLAILLLPGLLVSQDAYHQSLLQNLEVNYDLVGGNFLFTPDETVVLSSFSSYGALNATTVSETAMDFALAQRIEVTTTGNNAWDAGASIGTTSTISEGDLILLTFWARHDSPTSQVFVFAEEATIYDKEFYFPLSFSPDWTQYFVAFRSSADYGEGQLRSGFHLASALQDVYIAGFNAINYGDAYSIEDLPSTFSPFDYDGRSLDAPWRETAAHRIDRLRMADLTIQVVDADGTPLPDAEIQVEMQQHDFGFGTAVVSCRFPGNNCYDETYVNKMLDLDGRGHGFNHAVTENAVKWRTWEQGWLGPPEDAVRAFEWLTDRGVTMRGHTLIWPGEQWLPDDINDNLDDLDYLRTRIDARIAEMIDHPELKTYVRDWDVLNEITTNRTLESAFDADAMFTNGRKIYNEICNKVRAIDPDLAIYINDYVAISSGSANLVARYKTFLDELVADEVPFDGIGFQCHIGSIPNGIPQVEQTFNEFYQRYGKRMKVTEYDINSQVDEQTQADYMRDLLTLTFSHPGMDAFLMWGFWDGNHWKDNAPMFYQDWTLKPSGEVFIQKVFDEWWTSEETIADQGGKATLRVFKGDHQVTVRHGNEVIAIDVNVRTDDTLTVQLGGTVDTTVDQLDDDDIEILPNPVSGGSATIRFPEQYASFDMRLLDTAGRTICTYEAVESGDQIDIDVPSGTYVMIGQRGGHLFFSKSIMIP
jgi:GH35 family endo-1,4-beta-xylanase